MKKLEFIKVTIDRKSEKQVYKENNLYSKNFLLRNYTPHRCKPKCAPNIECEPYRMPCPPRR